VFTRGANGWARVDSCSCGRWPATRCARSCTSQRLRNFALRAIFSVPELTTVDFDGDGKLDLCAVIEDVLQVHKGGGPDGVCGGADGAGWRSPDKSEGARGGSHAGGLCAISRRRRCGRFDGQQDHRRAGTDAGAEAAVFRPEKGRASPSRRSASTAKATRERWRSAISTATANPTW